MKKLLGILLLAGATALTGCGDSEDFVFINNNTGVIQAPVCADDAYAVNSNAVLTVAAANGVLTNDTPNGATLTFAGTSANGGTIVGAQDGSFTYTPANNFAGTDTFTYTLGNSGGVVTCTVTVTVTAVNGFFVDAANGNDGTGNFTNGQPFATIQQALLAAPAGSDIVVRPGSYTGQVDLENGDRLLGEGSVLAQGTAVRPVLTGPVVMADGNTLDFLRIDGTAGDAVDGTGQNGGTVTNCEIANLSAGGDGVCAENVSGSWTISSNSITNLDGTVGLAIQLTTSGSSVATAVINNNNVTNSALAVGLTAENTSQLSAQVQGNNMTSNTPGATFEALVGDTATFCLDLENNTNDDVYSFGIQNTATANVEQFSTLAAQQVSGTVQVSAGGFFANPTEVADGACGF